MNKKLLLIFIPIAIVPYLSLFALATIFFSTTLPFFGWIMDSVFDSNALYLIAALLLYYILAVALSIVCFVVSIYAKWDALSLAKAAMIIKLIQIPAYVLIFVLGLMLLITIFTYPFSIALFMLNCLSMFMTGLLVIASVISAIRNNIFSFTEISWVILLQFVFCADVISSVIFYNKLKRLNNEE